MAIKPMFEWVTGEDHDALAGGVYWRQMFWIHTTDAEKYIQENEWLYVVLAVGSKFFISSNRWGQPPADDIGPYDTVEQAQVIAEMLGLQGVEP